MEETFWYKKGIYLNIIASKLVQLLFKRNCTTKIEKHSILILSVYLIQNYNPQTNNTIPSHKKANCQVLITTYRVYIL